MKRKIFRLLFILLVLLFVIVAAVQILLLTDMPRQWILHAANHQLGMKVTANSFRTELWGRTTIRNMVLSLPMEDEPILSIPKLTVSHSSLALAVLGRSLRLQSVTIEDPNLNIRQDQTGYWNIQEFALRLSEATVGKEKRRKVVLRELDITNAMISVTGQNDRTENLGPVRFHGKSEDEVRWDFEMDVPSKVAISGKLALGADWAHEINFNMRDINDLAQVLISDGPKPLSFSGRLYGRVHESELISKLDLEQFQLNRVQVHGTVGIDISKILSLVHFENLWVEGLGDSIDKVRVTGGTVQLDREQLHGKNILVETDDVLGRITGQWNWSEKAGTLAGSWTSHTSQSEIRHEGTWNGSISWPRIGPRKVSLSLTTQGRSAWAPWRSELNIRGSGSTWSTSQWQVSIPRLQSRWKDTDIILEAVSAEISADWPSVRLVSLAAANAEQLRASGVLSTDDLSWSLSIETNNLRPDLQQSPAVDVSLNASGNREEVSVKQLKVSHRGLGIEASGQIVLPSTELHNTHAKAFWAAHPDDRPQTLGEVYGDFQCQSTVTGTLIPTKLQLQSTLSGKDVTLNRKAIPAIEIPFETRIDTERVTCETESFELFGGIWDLKARHDLSQPFTQLTLDANEVLLQSIAELFHLPLTCQGAVATHLEIEWPRSDVNDLKVSGEWNTKDVIIPPIEADSAEGRICIQDGTARLEQIHLVRRQGQASANAWFRLDRPDRVSVEVQVEQWPADIPKRNVTFITDGMGFVVLDLVHRNGQGKGTLSTSITLDEKKLGHVSAELTADRRTVVLTEIHVDAFGGRAGGTATVPLDDWRSSQMELQWHDMDLTALADHGTALKTLTGKSSGVLTIAKAENPRPLEPLQIRIDADISNGVFRGVRFGDCTISGYVGKRRFLIDRSEFDVMSGTLSAWGYLRRRSGQGSAYVHGEFSRLDLDQLAHVFLPSAMPIQGRLDGTGMLVVLSDFSGMTGQADLRLNESDLARTAIIGTLYNAMNLKFDNRQPTGQGQMSVRFEGSSLKIPSFIYFNRGAEIRGAGTIDDIMQGKTSPIKGYAISSARPLKDIHLPGIRELDRLMASLQSGASSVRIRGTLFEPKVETVPLEEIDDALRVLLWRQLHE